jgi:hypothetical protein
MKEHNFARCFLWIQHLTFSSAGEDNERIRKQGPDDSIWV